MEGIAQERIKLIERHYAPLKNYKEQTLTPKKVNLQKYAAFFLGFFGLTAFIMIMYIALADIFSYRPNAWLPKVGFLVGNVASVLLLFFNSARNILVLSHFLRLKEMNNDSSIISSQYLNNQLDEPFLKFVKGKQLRMDTIFFAIILFFGFYAYFIPISSAAILSDSWEYMKFIVPVVYGILIF